MGKKAQDSSISKEDRKKVIEHLRNIFESTPCNFNLEYKTTVIKPLPDEDGNKEKQRVARIVIKKDPGASGNPYGLSIEGVIESRFKEIGVTFYKKDSSESTRYYITAVSWLNLLSKTQSKREEGSSSCTLPLTVSSMTCSKWSLKFSTSEGSSADQEPEECPRLPTLFGQ